MSFLGSIKILGTKRFYIGSQLRQTNLLAGYLRIIIMKCHRLKRNAVAPVPEIWLTRIFCYFLGSKCRINS